MQLGFCQGNTVYLIDTSGLIMLESTFKHDNPVFAAIWEEIEDLITQGCFKTIDFKPNKLPAIAKKNGVKSIDINEFLIERELRMERKKKD